MVYEKCTPRTHYQSEKLQQIAYLLPIICMHIARHQESGTGDHTAQCP